MFYVLTLDSNILPLRKKLYHNRTCTVTLTYVLYYL